MPFTNIRNFLTNRKTLIIISALFLSSCVTISTPGIAASLEMKPHQAGLSSKQKKIIKNALNACNMGYTNSLTFNNKTFNNDCSGLIFGIFWASGIDLNSMILKEKGGGVLRLYKVLDRRGLIHTKKLPNPGDIVFWDNTYGEWGKKPLSHAGIVVSVKDDGTIEYVHNNTYLGAIRKEKMNLFRPHENRPINNYMRYDSKYKMTAAELFDSFGMAWKL